jgi:hypothetical protein
MSSEVEICNMALSNIRAAGINSLDENSLQAQQCKLKYPLMRDMLLREAPWRFAHRIASLVVRVETVHNWVYVYQYPSDCLYINKILLNYENFSSDSTPTYRHRHIADIYVPDLDRQVKYDVMNVESDKVIVCNDVDVFASYRARVTNPNLFDTVFNQALAWLLAAELAVPLVGVEKGRALRQDAYQIYTAYLGSSIADDMNESYTVPPDSDFITIRN